MNWWRFWKCKRQTCFLLTFSVICHWRWCLSASCCLGLGDARPPRLNHQLQNENGIDATRAPQTPHPNKMYQGPDLQRHPSLDLDSCLHLFFVASPAAFPGSSPAGNPFCRCLSGVVSPGSTAVGPAHRLSLGPLMLPFRAASAAQPTRCRSASGEGDQCLGAVYQQSVLPQMIAAQQSSQDPLETQCTPDTRPPSPGFWMLRAVGRQFVSLAEWGMVVVVVSGF